MTSSGLERASLVFHYTAGDQDIFEDCELFDEEKEETQEQEGTPELSYYAPGPLAGIRAFLGWQKKDDQPDVEPTDEAARRGQTESGRQAPASPEEGMSEIFSPSKDSAISEDSGFFEKRSPFWVEGWRPRAYVLKDSKLVYFNPQRPDRPLGSLDFKLVSFEVHCCWSNADEAHHQMCRTCDVCDDSAPEDFHTVFLKPIQYPNKVFAFRGPSEEIKTLTRKMATLAENAWSPDKEEDAMAMVTVKNFWRYPSVRETDFLQRAESGDILLFRGKDRRSALTRTVSGFASYDHVALLLRTTGKRVVILEATGNEGVNLVPWSSFKSWRWHTCYDRIAYRKVYFARTADQLNRLEGFVKSQLGTRYGLTLNKIFKRKISREFDAQGNEISSPSQTDENDVNACDTFETSTGFFCSEIVAACLKRCGVLAGARASAQYWPGSFSQWCPNALPLQENVHVGAEEKIIYSDDEY